MNDEQDQFDPSSTPSTASSRGAKGKQLVYTTRLSALGLALSFVLEFVHARTFLKPASDSFCSVGEAFDCAAVAASKFSVFLGLPWALWGIVGFCALLIASVKRSYFLLPLSALAATGSLALLIVSLFLVGAVCYLCEAVHAISWGMLYFAWRGRRSLVGGPASIGEATGILAGPAGLAVALWIFVPNYWAAFTYRSEPPYPTGTTEEGLPWIGSEHPDITLEEYVDYACPHCRAQSTITLRALARHPEIRLVRRQQPRMRCEAKFPEMCKFSRLALCAQDQDRFWRADRWLFAHVDPRKEPDLIKMSHDLGLDEEKLRACYMSAESFERARAEYRSAVKSGISFVPGHKVNGKRITRDELEQLLD